MFMLEYIHLPVETLEKIRLGTANAMKRPEVIGKVRANHLPVMHTEESKVRRHGLQHMLPFA